MGLLDPFEVADIAQGVGVIMTAIQITSDQLRKIMPAAGNGVNAFSGPLSEAMSRFEINTTARIAPFIASVAEESDSLRRVIENLNYSAEGLRNVFPTHFLKGDEAVFAHNQRAIADRVYANRFGNGNEASGDGWRYRGRGLIQITFKENYAACGAGIGYDLVGNPDLLAQPGPGALSAAWYWHAHGLNALADAGDFRGVTRHINGGLNGYKERVAFLVRAETVLGKAGE